MKMAELIASLDGPVYVERVALFAARQRMKAAKAIKKAVQLQKEGRGYAFIEVLAECPTHLKMTPEKAEKWVKESMGPVFPLGVKKDTTVEPWFKRPAPLRGRELLRRPWAPAPRPRALLQGLPHPPGPHDIS